MATIHVPPAGSSYVARQVAAAAVANFTFSGLNSTTAGGYRLVINGMAEGAAAFGTMTLNGNAPAERSTHSISQLGTLPAGEGAVGPGLFSDATGLNEAKISDGGTSWVVNWTGAARVGGNDARSYYGAATWSQTGAITTIVWACSTNFEAGTVATLYRL